MLHRSFTNGRRLRVALLAGLLTLPLALVPGSNPAKADISVPSGFVDALVAEVPQPTALASTPDGRLLIATQPGRLHIFRNSTLLPAPALDLAAVTCPYPERGMNGVAVDPNFAANHFIYVYYSFNKFDTCSASPRATAPVNRVSRFVLPDTNVIDPAGEVVLLDNIPALNVHNGGDLKFGPDGFLYVSVGDGGCRINDPSQCQALNDNARNPSWLLGKMLRIRATDGGFPPDNPYATDPDVRRCGDPAGVPPGTGRCGEIFATGLRNPFQFSFKPNTNVFYINDVGTNIWEEIDEGKKGADYGFNLREGPCANNSRTDCGPPPAGLTDPIHSYDHNTDCSAITGSAWVPEGLWPAPYSGSYLYGDYVCGKIFRLAPKAGGGFTAVPFLEGLGGSSIIGMAFGPFGKTQALYYTTFTDGGAVRRVVFGTAATLPPTAAFTATPASGQAPLDVTLNASTSTDPDNDPLTYHWDFGDGTSLDTTAKSTVHRYDTDGNYTVTLRVTDDAQLSAPATKDIEVGNPPTAAITSPSSTATFAVGQLVTVTGKGTDPDDGNLAPSRLSWTVIRHHHTHTHPFLGPVTGDSVTFRYPEPEDLAAAADSYLEVSLTATDATGLRRTVSQNLLPKKVTLTLNTNRSTALKLQANELTFNGTASFTSWVGYQLRITAPSPQAFTDRYYAFRSWSDGGAASHLITTPPAAATYTANFDRFSGSPPAPPPPPPPPPSAPYRGIARTATGNGYWVPAQDGRVLPFGDAKHFGDAASLALNQPVLGMTATPSGAGYHLVAADGGIFSYGDAKFYGSTGAIKLNKPVVAMASTPTGGGYWMVATDGGIFSFGDAVFYGSTGNLALNKPIVAMAVTPSGHGYWLVASDGGIFAFGDAGFFGSTGSIALNKPIVSMAPNPDGAGYWLMASDGGLFSYGTARFFGSTGAAPPPAPGTQMAAIPSGAGYWLAFANGQVFAFGGAKFYGSAG
jgi:glucose/arabinose dehydrogenase